MIGVEQAAHHGTALIIATGTLAAGTGEATTTRRSVVLELIRGAGAGVSSTGLGNVTDTCTRSADCVCGRKLAFCATAVIGVVADGIVLELACLCVAASIGTAAFLAATVAVFASFDDAVAASAAAHRYDSAIVGETG
jgi:hypothetical protein